MSVCQDSRKTVLTSEGISSMLMYKFSVEYNKPLYNASHA